MNGVFKRRNRLIVGNNRAIITAQEENKTPSVDLRGKFTGGILYQLKNGCNRADLPKDFPPYSRVLWHYKQWCEDDILNKIMTELHGRVREQVKKKPQWTTLIMIDSLMGEKYL